ncbi:helix-turn-helix domain-containing protein [Xanthomonas cucurbitae]|uniref:helix-turn-helix domain-containing protein n=1 Tax=Xanthomonas cucurbitae TaxID=56453 RepID=UPI003CCD68D1
MSLIEGVLIGRGPIEVATASFSHARESDANRSPCPVWAATCRGPQDQGTLQERLALESGLARSYLGGVERGQRNIALLNIYRLAEALGVHPTSLLEPHLPDQPRMNNLLRDHSWWPRRQNHRSLQVVDPW